MKKTLAIAFLTAAMPTLAFAQAANISTTDLTTAGFNINTSATTAPSTSINFSNDGNTVIVVKTASGTTVSATARSQGQICQQGYGCTTPSDVAVNVPSNGQVVMGPFPKGRWNNSQFDTVKVDITATPGVSVSALRLPPQ